MLKSEKNIFWGIIAAFIVTRMVIILFFIDTIYNPKETYVGFISTELLSGDLKIPLYDYIMMPKHFSNILVAILMMPFIFIFGNNLIAVKLFALFIATINLGVWYLLLRNISQRTAVFFSIIYIFTPTMATNVMLISWPPYALTSLFMGISLLLLVKMLNSKQENYPRAALLGVVCGVGGWIYYLHLLFLSFVFLSWGMKDKLFFLKKQFAVFAFFFLIGIAPWLLYNIHDNFSATIFFREETFGNLHFLNFLDKAKKIITIFMPNFFFYRGTHLSTGFIYYFLFILSYIAVIVNLIKNLNVHNLSTPKYAIKFAVAFFLFTYLIILSNITFIKSIRASYMAFLCPFILSIIALGLTYVRPIFQKGFLVMIIFCHIFTYSYRMPYAKFLQGLSYKADSGYDKLGTWDYFLENYDHHRFYNMLEKFPHERKQNILIGYLVHIYSVKGFNFDGIDFLMSKYGHQYDVFCDVMIIQERYKFGISFTENIQDGINLCGKARYTNWEKMELRTDEVFEVVSAIESLNDNDQKEIMYFYLGKVASYHKRKDFYEFYKEIPHSYRYRYIQGHAFEEITRVSGKGFFFRPEHINNFGVIENRIQEILLSVPDNDEKCIKDVYAAYIPLSYVVFALVTHEYYLMKSLNKKTVVSYLKKIKNKETIAYIQFRLKELLEKENGFFSKILGGMVIMENGYLSKAIK